MAPGLRRPEAPATSPPRAPGLLLGVGLGGFLDGIVLHQVLQWHHMLTATDRFPADTVAGLETNTVADGLFHAATWIFVAVGMSLAIRDWQRGRLAPPWSFHVGLLVTGWGMFNVVEGLVDHHLLRIHHVRDDVSSPVPWDIGFLAFGAGLVVVGLLLVRHGRGTTRHEVPDSALATRGNRSPSRSDGLPHAVSRPTIWSSASGSAGPPGAD